jgi:hypothetical protein
MSENNRELLKATRLRLGQTQTATALFLAEVTQRPCTLRTVQSWEADPALSSSRACPDWPIRLLAAEAARLGR